MQSIKTSHLAYLPLFIFFPGIPAAVEDGVYSYNSLWFVKGVNNDKGKNFDWCFSKISFSFGKSLRKFLDSLKLLFDDINEP